MIPAANRYTVVLDASVLFPNMKRDLLLRFFEADLYRARWTEKIHHEWLSNAKAKYPSKTDRLDRTAQLVRKNFEDAWIEDGKYERYVELVELPDPEDRHVVAAAIECKASYIVTDNLKDFPEQELAKFDVEAGSADKFLSGTFDHYQNEAFADLRRHRQGLRSAPSPADYLMMLRAKGLPLLSARLTPMKEFL